VTAAKPIIDDVTEPLATPARIGFAGDWHMNAAWAVAAIRHAAERRADVIVHVGDFGYTFDGRFVRRLDAAAWRVLSQATARGLNAPLTSSAGRLFDAVASLLGLRDRVTFEGQAAMELEALAESRADTTYPARLDDRDGTVVVRTTDIVRGIVDDLLREVPPARIAARFHATLAEVIVRVCEGIRARTGLAAAALSGGVFQNVWLLQAVMTALEAGGFEVYSHHHVPSNDGGLALGQAAVIRLDRQVVGID